MKWQYEIEIGTYKIEERGTIKMADAPQPIEPSKQMEVRQAINKFGGDFWRGFHTTNSKDIELNGQRIAKDMGPIDEMTLAGNWTGGTPEYGRNTPAYIRRTYQLADEPQAILKYNDRGLRIPQTDGNTFRALLSEPFDKSTHAHQINDPESLKTSQSRVLNFMDPDNIALEKASVLEVGGKRVLMIRGEYIRKNEDDPNKPNIPFLKMYFPADEKGTAIREVEYQAPKGAFAKHLKAVEDALWSIKWKTEE